MKPTPIHRLPAPLEAAVQRLKQAARAALERTVESLGLAALSAPNVVRRDDLLVAQFELNRKSGVFMLAFNDAFDELVARDAGVGEVAAPRPTTWDALSLVEDHVVEKNIAAERFALEVSNTCEWEMRELDGYVGSLLGQAIGDSLRNPLRPELIGHALLRGVEVVSERAELQKLLSAELGRSLGGELRATYADIVSRMRSAGVQPMSLAVRQRQSQAEAAHVATDFDTLGRPIEPGLARDSSSGRDSRSGRDSSSGRDSRSGRGGDSRHGNSGYSTSGGMGRSTRGGATLGSVDATMMALMRRLAAHHPGSGGGNTGYDTTPQAHLPNLIHAHRRELREASTGGLDHMVIDVIGTLFDQILSDPKVPPQLARQIARLQLPVLRAALGDASFFASRRHPVRRFINRIASLGASFDDFAEGAAHEFLLKVRDLVQEVVEGDFERIEPYEAKLAALESFAAALALKEVAEQGVAAEMLAQKEDEMRLRALYARQLDLDLRGLSAPPFLLEFMSQVWSEVLLRVAAMVGADGAQSQRLRAAGRELMLSVQPKPTPAHRKAFLTELPRLMQALNDGMTLIAYPEADRRAFFGRLMPAHAEALKATSSRQLDINLMARQVEGALAKPMPSRADLALPGVKLPVLDDEIVIPKFSAEEARQIGLVDEASVNWDGKVDIDVAEIAEQKELARAAEPIGPLPAATGPVEPTQGRELAGFVQVGLAYQMHLEDAWHKVRLVHVSPGRTFFVFTRGERHKRALSLTHRMLVRMCDSSRMRAHESASLFERATSRARRKLAELAPVAG